MSQQLQLQVESRPRAWIRAFLERLEAHNEAFDHPVFWRMTAAGVIQYRYDSQMFWKSLDFVSPLLLRQYHEERAAIAEGIPF